MNQSENTVTTIPIVHPKDFDHDHISAKTRGATMRWRFTLLIMRSMSIKFNKLHILLTTWMCHDELFDYHVILVI